MPLQPSPEIVFSSHRGAFQPANDPGGFAPLQWRQASHFAPGSEIYGPGDDADSLYQVKSGAVRIYRLSLGGRRQISAFHMPGEVFGFESGTSHSYFAQAISATVIRTLPRRSNTDISGELLPMSINSLVRTQEHLLVLGRSNACERVAAFLINMAERQGSFARFELPMSRLDIADYLGLTIETVSRVFSKLKEKGIIRLPGVRSVEIVRRQALVDMSD